MTGVSLRLPFFSLKGLVEFSREYALYKPFFGHSESKMPKSMQIHVDEVVFSYNDEKVNFPCKT